MSVRRYRHVIWDWNGTLLDDVGLSVEVANALLTRRGRPPLSRERYLDVFDFPVRAYYERLGLDLGAAGAFAALSAEWVELYEARRLTCPLQPGAAATLERIAGRGLPQSILSAYPQPRLAEVVAHFGLGRHFVRLLGLDDIYAHSKLELGRRWVAELALPPGDILLVGDTLHDLDVAETLGLDCALVAHGHHAEHRLRARTGRVFADLASLTGSLGLA